MIMVGKEAPNFKAQAFANGVVKEIDLEEFSGQYKVLFFYPLDFTFVCPTELHAFQEKLDEFKARNTAVIGCSVDSVHSHAAWARTAKKDGGICGVEYPLLSDLSKQIAYEYGVLDEEQGIALRGVFIIDSSNIIQSVSVNNLPLGRNVDEVLRLIDALQFSEKHGKVCPANWSVGKKAMMPTDKGVKEYFAE